MNTHKNVLIMEKAVRKAVDNGWDMFGELPFKFKGGGSWAIADKKDRDHTPLLIVQGTGEAADYRAFYELEQIVFNLRFTLALWGEAENELLEFADPDNYTAFEAAENVTYQGPAWKFHLMQMVIAYDRVDYIGANS